MYILDIASLGQSINIEHKTREAILSTVDNGLDDFSAFYHAQKEIYQLMLTDSFPRFKREALSMNADKNVQMVHLMVAAVFLVAFLALFLALVCSSVTRWARIAVFPLLGFLLLLSYTSSSGGFCNQRGMYVPHMLFNNINDWRKRRTGTCTRYGVTEKMGDKFIKHMQRMRSIKTVTIAWILAAFITAGCVACPVLAYY